MKFVSILSTIGHTFFFRSKSLEPYSRHLTGRNIFDMIQIQPETITSKLLNKSCRMGKKIHYFFLI